jgi:hypothetical protein
VLDEVGNEITIPSITSLSGVVIPDLSGPSVASLFEEVEQDPSGEYG